MPVPKHELTALIGMPTAGKTKIGKRLAQHLGCSFVDTDERIVAHFKAKRLQDVVDSLSPSDFVKAEELVIIQTVTALSAPTIIATGGSAVYSERAMECLCQRTFVIHLCASLQTIERRVAKNPERGLVLGPGETIADLYERRMPLYKKWEHLCVDTNERRSKVAKRLATRLVEQGAMPAPIDA